MGSYEQLIFVIRDLICTYFPVVTLYYWYQHVAISSQMMVHYIQLLRSTKLMTQEISKTTCERS